MHQLVVHHQDAEQLVHLQFVLTTLVLFIPGIPFLSKGLPALLRDAPT